MMTSLKDCTRAENTGRSLRQETDARNWTVARSGAPGPGGPLAPILTIAGVKLPFMVVEHGDFLVSKCCVEIMGSKAAQFSAWVSSDRTHQTTLPLGSATGLSRCCQTISDALRHASPWKTECSRLWRLTS